MLGRGFIESNQQPRLPYDDTISHHSSISSGMKILIFSE